MVYIYNYNTPNDSGVVQVLSFKTYSKIALFSRRLAETVPDYVVLSTPKTADLNSLIRYSIIFNADKLPFETYMEEPEFEACLLVKSVLNKLMDGADTVSLHNDTGEVTFTLLNTYEGVKLTRMNLYKDGLRYESLNESVKSEFGLVKKLSALATVEDMKKRYDCSWIFDENGNMKKDYKSITTLEDLKWLKGELQKLPDDFYIGYDVETTGLKIFYMEDEPEKKDRLLGFSISWKDNQAVYVPLESKVFECLTKETVFDEIYDELVRLKIIAHNGQFEWKVQYDNGRTLDIAEDTMVLDFNIFPMIIPGWRTLKNLTRVHFGHETWEFSQLFGGKADPEMLVYLPLDLITIYGCADSDYARMLYFKLMKYLNKSQMFCYRLDCDIIELLAKSEYYGVGIYKNEVDRQRAILEKDLKVLEVLMNSYVMMYGYQVFLEEHVMEFVEFVKATEPNISQEDLLSRVNSHIDFEELKETFKNFMETKLENKPYTSGKVLSEILYDVLKYPVVLYTTPSKKQREDQERRKREALEKGIEWKPKPPQPATNEEAMVILESYRLAEPSKFLKGDLKSYDGESILLKADDLNSMEYPLAAMLLQHKRITKLLTTFFKQQKENDSKYLYNENNATAAATARLVSTVQTISGSSKKMVVPYPNTYGVNADYSQIEIRNMAGNANSFWKQILPRINQEELSVYHRQGLDKYIESLNNPETDVHRVTAANMLGINPEEVTKSQRSNGKQFSFGVPYGMGSFSLSADSIIKYVDRLSSSAQNQIEYITIDGGVGLAKWSYSNYPIYKFLEVKRAQALRPVKHQEEEAKERENDILPPYFDGREVGYVTSMYGRRRYFYLEDLDGAQTASIKKAAGNFPVQSGSRDLFFINKKNLYEDMKKCGLVTNPTHGEKPTLDKFTMTAFVHDEFFGFAQMDVHPFLLVNLIHKNCFVHYKDHPHYFMGVNFVNTWYDGKAGTRELPVDLVRKICALPKEKWPVFENGYFLVKNKKLWVVDYFGQLIANWELGRVVAEIVRLSGCKVGTPASEIDFKKVSDKLVNYAVKPLVVEHSNNFGASSKNNFADRLKLIWENKNHNYFDDDVEESRIMELVEVKESRGQTNHFGSFSEVAGAEVVEEEVDISELLFANEDSTTLNENGVSSDELFSEEEDFDPQLWDAKTLMADKEAARQKENEEIYRNYLYDTGEVNFTSVEAKREKYIPKNMNVDRKVDSNVFIMISGKLVLNLSNIKPSNISKVVEDVKEQFYCEGGSIFEYITRLGKKRADFRVFNLDRNKLEAIMKKYY